MEKLIKWLHLSRVLTYIVPIVLLVFLSTLALSFNPDLPPFSILLQSDNSMVKNFQPEKPIYKGQKIQGEFKAKFDNIGTLGVRFFNFKHISDDVVIFRIKEKGQKEWFYQNTYKVDQFQPDDFFPFGFPVIQNSANVNYIFEVESTRGRRGNAIGLSKKLPTLEPRFSYKMSEISTNPAARIVEFLFIKFINIYLNKEKVLFTIIYLSPFLMFIATKLKTFELKKKIATWMSIYIVLLFSEIFLVDSKVREVHYLVLVSYWIFILYHLRFESRSSFFLALALFPIMVLFSLMDQSFYSEQFAIWIYQLLIVGILHSFVSLKYRQKREVQFFKHVRFMEIKK